METEEKRQGMARSVNKCTTRERTTESKINLRGECAGRSWDPKRKASGENTHRIPRYTVLPARHQRGNNLVGNDPDQHWRKARKPGVLLDCRLEPALSQGMVHSQTALNTGNKSSRTRSTETRSLGSTGARKTRLESGSIELSDRNVTLDTLGLGRNTANVEKASATGSNANNSRGADRGARSVPTRPLTATRPVEYKAFLALFDGEH